VSSWLSFATSSWAGPVFLLVTLAGLVLSGIAWRKKGARSGIRGIAWSLLPIAAWLTHALGLIGRIVSAIVQFAGSFVFTGPGVWLGVILVALAVVLFLVSGGLPFVGWRKHRKDKKDGRSGGGKPPAAVTKSRGKAAVPASQDDDLSDVQDILKRHGIS